MRGNHISRPIEELTKEASNLVRNGVRELLVIAQDSTYYGLDLYGKRKLGDLLLSLSDIEGLDWIRLHYAFPTGFPKEVLKIMAERENICNYLDIPLQHGSSRMLETMKRGITREKTEQLIEEIRSAVPGIALRTTLIAGHPGETEEDFEQMLSFVEKSRFDRLGVFAYSHEENTHSFTMKDEIPFSVKQDRLERVMDLQEKISWEINQTRIGKEYKVLIDRAEGGTFIGRTEFDSPEVDNEVIIDSPDQYLRQGDFVQVKINDASEFDLFGTPSVKSYI